MRRGSLVGPLLLVLIGVWFLISMLRPDWPLFDVAARFWPFVLIGWGALRLVEILIWAARGRALPRAGLSGGEWTLIVFICLFGAGLYEGHRHYPAWNFGMIGAHRMEIFGHSHDYTVPEAKIQAGKATRVLIENLQGTVRVNGADVREITCDGHKSIRSLEERDADTANKQSAIEMNAQGDQIVVRTNQDRVTGEQRVSTDLDVTVPRTVTVEVRGRHGDIEINDLNGAVEISSDNAEVRLQNIGGNARLDVRKSDSIRAAALKGTFEVQAGRGGDVDLDNIAGEVTINGSYSGGFELRNLAKALHVQTANTELRVERVPGQIHLDLGELTGANLIGPIHFTSGRSRDVQLDQFTQSLEMTLDRGDITLRPLQMPLAKIDARTRNGQVDIALPADAKFALRAVTNRGELTNDFGPALRTVSDEMDEHRDRRGGSIVGTVGQGPNIVVETDRGSITVRKDSGTPLVAHNKPQPDSHQSHPRSGHPLPPEVEEH